MNQAWACRNPGCSKLKNKIRHEKRAERQSNLTDLRVTPVDVDETVEDVEVVVEVEVVVGVWEVDVVVTALDVWVGEVVDG